MLLSRCCSIARAVRVLRASTQFTRACATSGRVTGESMNNCEKDSNGAEKRVVDSDHPGFYAEKELSDGCFTRYNLQHDIVKKLRDAGINRLLEVQHETFDSINSGKDVCVQARTGTGKTLAYALPILQNVLEHKELHPPPTKKKSAPPARRKPQQQSNQKYFPLAVVLAPTRELAVQIHKEFETFKPCSSIKVSCFYGGCSFNWQDAEVREGIDVLVATPGRLLDHIRYRNISLKRLRHFVIDEADRMFDMGFQDQLSKILQSAFSFYTTKPQMLLFSATLPDAIVELAQPYMCESDYGDAENFDFVSGGVKSALSLEHVAVKCDWFNHGKVIRHLMKLYGGKCRKAIVFVSNKTRADALASDPALEAISGVIHSSLSQTKRNLMLRSFRDGGVDCLIATDVASRGLDILDVDLIIQCEPPVDADDYVHRAGRTGRVGQKGVNVVLYNRGQMSELENIERTTGVLLRFESLHPNDIIKSEAEDVLESLDQVESHAQQRFCPTAKSMIIEHGAENALAAALAVLAGRGPSVGHSNVAAISGSKEKVINNDSVPMEKSSLKNGKRRIKSKRSF